MLRATVRRSLSPLLARSYARLGLFSTGVDEATSPTSLSPETGEEVLPGAEGTAEIKDPTLVFNTAWSNIQRERGEQNMIFPKEIMWLAGAPGAGKGTMTPYIMEERGIIAPPLEVSSLFRSSPIAREKMDKGLLLGDREVVEVLLRELLKEEYRNGVIVDGFPRTLPQSASISLLFDQMTRLRKKFEFMPEFRRPVFSLVVLYVEEEESVRRQLSRGVELKKHNRRVQELGVGKLWEPRETDTEVEKARLRYLMFKEEVYGALQAIKDKFSFHFIDASGPPEDVQKRLVEELAYQSSLELGEETFEMLRTIPTAANIVEFSRQKLVQRLDGYARRHPELLASVIKLIDRDFMYILERQAFAGEAIIRSDNHVFETKLAVDMTLDILTERGFRVVLDVTRERLPHYIEQPNRDGESRIYTSERRFQTFHIYFDPPRIRRG